ncbi:hypothetical protein CHARACLAT_031816 [Characodon lateralis]|uniref:Uncharacterized protein n=1 Tax=Characodon lateralis TaxID=208331 RepID=A0ABU7DC33_9TELE|nr:hypothetical protein [Characodon lateralis]
MEEEETQRPHPMWQKDRHSPGIGTHHITATATKTNAIDHTSKKRTQPPHPTCCSSPCHPLAHSLDLPPQTPPNVVLMHVVLCILRRRTGGEDGLPPPLTENP